jgi:hypothetical protein
LGRVVQIDEHGKARGARQQVMEQLEPPRPKLAVQRGDNR